MQANSQRSGHLQNFHGKRITPENGGSTALGQNIYQLHLQPHSGSSSYPGKSATGSYLTQFTCTIPPATSDQILTSSIQATKDAEIVQENQFNPMHTLPAGQQNSQLILWNMPSSCQILIPVNNINIQNAPINSNMSSFAFNSNNSLFMHQQSPSLAAGSNNSQQGKTKKKVTKNPNEARRNVNTSSLRSRQLSAIAPAELPKESLKIRLSLPSNVRYCSPTENAPHSHSNLSGGYNHPVIIPEKSTHANMQALSTCGQNIAAQRAVAVVTPLSPIGTAPVKVSDNAANMKINVKPVQEIVYHQPNIPHPLALNANVINQTEVSNAPTSKHQQPQSAEPRLNDDLCNAVPAVVPDESTSQSHNASSQKLKSVLVEPETSIEIQNELNERVKKLQKVTENSGETDTIHFIEWPLNRLCALIQQIEDGTPKNLHKSDAGRDILKLYWNGDVRTFHDAVQTGMYQNVMEEVYVYNPMKEPVIVRQMLDDAHKKVIKDFHILKHNEEPPKLTYKSSWLNLNENVDDIDKECGYPWFYKYFAAEHEAQDFASKAPIQLQVSSEKPSPSSKLFPSDVDKIPVEKTTLNNGTLHQNWPVSCAPNCTISLQGTITVAKDQDILTGMSGLDGKYCSDVGAKDVAAPITNPSGCTNSPKLNHLVAEQQEVVFSEIKIGSSEQIPDSDCAVLNKNGGCETLAKPELASNGKEETDKMEEKVIATSPDKHETFLLNAPQDRDTTSSEEQICTKRSHTLNTTDETGCQPNTEYPLKAMTSLVRFLKNRQVSLKYKNLFEKRSDLKRKHQNSSATLKRFTPVQSESVHSDSDTSIRCESDTKSGPELEEKGDNTDTSASIKIPSLSHEMAKQCYANQSMDDKDIAESPEMHKASLAHDVTTNEEMSMGSLEKTSGNISVSETKALIPAVKSHLDDLFSIGATSSDCDMDVSTSFSICVLPHEVAKQCFAGQFIEDISAPPEMMHKPDLLNSPIDTSASPSMERLKETDGNCSQMDNVVAEQTNWPSNTAYTLNEMKNQGRAEGKSESSEEMCDTDCIIIDDPKPSEKHPVNRTESEVKIVDALDLIKIDVLPREMAELWFSGEMENKNLKKETAVHISNDDQIQNLAVGFENEESLEHMEKKYQSSDNEKLNSFCCLGKLFQTLQNGSSSLCTCHKNVEFGEKEFKIEDRNKSLKIQTENENPKEAEMAEQENTASEVTDDSENTEDENPFPSDATVGISSSEKVYRVEIETSEPARDESSTKCSTDETLTHKEVEQDNPDPDMKRTTNKICLTLYGTSSERKKEHNKTKRYEETESCEEPPETLQITKRKRKSIKRKGVESENEDMESRERIKPASLKNMARRRSLPSHPFSELGKNVLSTTSVRKPLSPKSDSHSGNGIKLKRKHKGSTHQTSMNKYIIRGKSSLMLHSPVNVLKSKYELGNPALMPLQDSVSLEFKVLPESFNFDNGAEPERTQDDGMAAPDDQSKKKKTGNSTIQGVWSFSPLKKKNTQSTEATNVSGPCSLFQEFKKRYHEKKDVASKMNLNSSKRP